MQYLLAPLHLVQCAVFTYTRAATLVVVAQSLVFLNTATLIYKILSLMIHHSLR